MYKGGQFCFGRFTAIFHNSAGPYMFLHAYLCVQECLCLCINLSTMWQIHWRMLFKGTLVQSHEISPYYEVIRLSRALISLSVYLFCRSTGVPDRGLCIPIKLSLLAAKDGGALFWAKLFSSCVVQIHVKLTSQKKSHIFHFKPYNLFYHSLLSCVRN